MANSFGDPRSAGETFTATAERGWWPGNSTDPHPTLNGVTQETYDRWRLSHRLLPQSVHLMTLEEQTTIYDGYWVACAGVLVARASGALAVCHFDAAFNAGAPQAAKFLQMTAGVDQDGQLGSESWDGVTRAVLVSEDATVDAYLQNRWDFLQRLANFPAWATVWARRENRLALLCGVSWRVPGYEALT
jgi:lysozyme family protein